MAISAGSETLGRFIASEMMEVVDPDSTTLAAVTVTAVASSVSLVIPARNEARNVALVLQEIPECVDEVILVDGDSDDATVAMARYCRPDIRVIRQDVPGKGAALRAGFRAATGDVIVMMDADGSMSASEIPHFLWYLDHGFDYVKGSRFAVGGGSRDITALRWAGNRTLLAIVNLLYDTNLSDLCYGFCAFRRCWLDNLELTAIGFEIETEMTVHALRAGLRIAEVPSFELPRRSGRSGLRACRDGLRVLRTVVRDRRFRGCGLHTTGELEPAPVRALPR